MQPLGVTNYLAPEIFDRDFAEQNDLGILEKMQGGDIWSLGILLLESWMFFNQSLDENIPSNLNEMDLRSTTEHARENIIQTYFDVSTL